MLQVILALNPQHAERLAHLHPTALVIDHERNTLRRGKTTVRLEPNKFRILFSIALQLGGLRSKTDLFDEFWGYREDGGPDSQEKLVEVHVCKIRKALPSLGIAIETVYCRGYRLVDIAAPAQTELRRAA